MNQSKECDGLCGWSHVHCKFCTTEIIDYSQGFVCTICSNNIPTNKSKANNLKEEIQQLTEQIVLLNKALYKLKKRCTHVLKDTHSYWGSATCSICGEGFGWSCESSPDGVCHYFSQGDGTFVQLIDKTVDTVLFKTDPKWNPEYETDDSCLYCGEPEERK